MFDVYVLASSAGERRGGDGRGKPLQITGPGAQEEGPTLLHMFLSFSVVFLFVDSQINLFRQSPSHSVTDSQSFLLRDSV